MKCPFCTCTESKVLETRVGDDLETVRRRRECFTCGKRFTTYERVEYSPLTVMKRDGRRERFDREKLLRGLHQSCERTRVTNDQIEQIVGHVEQKLRGQGSSEVTSASIGDIIAEQLKAIDKVAYIRFASVFRRFVDVEEFKKEIKKL